MNTSSAYTTKEKWNLAFREPHFRVKFYTGVAGVIGILAFFPWFFQYIQARQGTQLNDFLLDRFPAVDVSIFIFILIWFSAVWMLIYAFRHPHTFLVLAWSYFFLCVSRITTITLIPLEPPHGIIDLVDPLTNMFYGKHFVSKDLFYSGHTSTLVLFSCVFAKRKQRILMTSFSVALGVLLLVQHVHYTIDVVAAFPFTWIMYWFGKKFTGVKSPQKASPN